jgi:hypothetical protein
MNVLPISAAQARRFALLATRILSPMAGVGEALQHLGYVQLDPLNVCGRMHDLVLRNRVQDYRPGALLEALHGSAGGRLGFEHYIPGRGILVAWPLSAYRYIRAHLSVPARGSARRTFSPEERRMGDTLLEQVRARGTLRSEDVEHPGRAQTAWGTQGRLVKVVLEKLFASGELAIVARRDFRRIYALPERVFAAVADQPPPTPEEFRRWAAGVRLRQRRLAVLRPSDAALLGGAVQALRIEKSMTVYCLREDLPLLERANAPLPGEERTRLLAPLDPVIYDRRLTARLWEFAYTWEVYTPAHKRVRGYYSLPVLRDLEILGDVEPRVDWQRRRLTLRSRRVRRGVETRAALAELADFLGVSAAR